MGAYEFQIGCSADINGDGELNVFEFVAFQLFWQAQTRSGLRRKRLVQRG